MVTKGIDLLNIVLQIKHSIGMRGNTSHISFPNMPSCHLPPCDLVDDLLLCLVDHIYDYLSEVSMSMTKSAISCEQTLKSKMRIV